MKAITIRDIKAFVTAPHGNNLVVVKVETSEPELYGVGCATFTWRYKAVVTAIEEYLRPFLIGRSVHDIEDIWQSMMGSSYWRNGPVLNNALSGVDEALWDIKVNLQECRCTAYLAESAERESLFTVMQMETVRKKLRRRFMHLWNRDSAISAVTWELMVETSTELSRTWFYPENAPKGAYYSSRTYMQIVVKLFDRIRTDIGWNLEIMHDIHERLSGRYTEFYKELEQFKPFFIEDALAPDQVGYFKYLRGVTAVPLAMGSWPSHPLREGKPIVQNQWIDFIRCHLSDIGGLTPARKVAAFCEQYQVRTAWHGPNDLSPIGMAAQMHLDLCSPNFGIQEFAGFNEAEEEVFPGCPQVRNGYAYLNDKPNRRRFR